MDDGGKDFRRGKPQQQFYKPGSGPLRKSTLPLDIKMDKCKLEHSYKDNDSQTNSKQQIFSNSCRSRKPEQQLYIPKSSGDVEKQTPLMNSDNYSSLPYEKKSTENSVNSNNISSYSRDSNKNTSQNDSNYNRNHRQVSEPKSMSPSHVSREESSNIDRNRDSRSMESSAGRHTGGGGKPPSGRRNSSGYPTEAPRHKYTVNLDNLPPRLRKKFLAESGHQSLDSNEYNKGRCSPHQLSHSNQQNPYPVSTPMWSQTLPSRGRGRLREDRIDKDRILTQYLRGYDDHNSRRSTPTGSYTNLNDSHVIYNSDSFINNHSSMNLENSQGMKMVLKCRMIDIIMKSSTCIMLHILTSIMCHNYI